LADELAKFQGDAEIFITHLKPDEVELIMREIKQCAGRFNPRMLLHNHEFEF